MTVVPSPGSGNLPDTMDDLDTGLEDFGLADAVIPRLTIKHQEGFFKDSLSNREFDKIETILLGLVRQRVLWHHVMDDDDAAPMCKSTNFNIGWPNVSDDQPKDKRFPWDKSNFNQEDFPPDEDGQVQLPCASCVLKEWGSHPDGKKPYCTEQFTMPLLYRELGSDDNFVVAVTSFQKTSIKPLRSYLSDFKRSNNPAYTVITEIGLDQLSRGGNKYCVATFRQGDKTDPENWRKYSADYRGLRHFLMQPPTLREEEEATSSAPSDNTARPPTDKAPEREPAVKTEEPKSTVNQNAASPAASVPTPPSDADQDDLPF